MSMDVTPEDWHDPEVKREWLKKCYQKRLEIQTKIQADSVTLKMLKDKSVDSRILDWHKMNRILPSVKSIDELPTSGKNCVLAVYLWCRSSLAGDVKMHAKLVELVSRTKEVESLEDRIAKCEAEAVEFEHINNLLLELIDEYEAIERAKKKEPHCGISTDFARRTYQNMMNRDFDGILRPKSHNHYHYRHDDNIASAAGGYSGGYQPLISGESLGSVASSVVIIGASSVVMIFCVFCVCLAFGMVIYYAYSQKRTKEEMRWIDHGNRNEI